MVQLLRPGVSVVLVRAVADEGGLIAHFEAVGGGGEADGADSVRELDGFGQAEELDVVAVPAYLHSMLSEQILCSMFHI